MFASPVWSPDGRWIAYVKFRYEAYSNEAWIELFNLEHGTTKCGHLRATTRLGSQMAEPMGGCFTLVDEPPPSQNTSNFWVVVMDSSTGRTSAGLLPESQPATTS